MSDTTELYLFPLSDLKRTGYAKPEQADDQTATDDEDTGEEEAA